MEDPEDNPANVSKSLRRTRTTNSPHRREHLKKTLSDKPDRSTRARRKSMAEAGKANSFSQNSKMERIKDLGGKHQKMRQLMQQDEEDSEMSLEELVPKKTRNTGHDSKVRSGIENLANMSINRNHASKASSFDGSWNFSPDSKDRAKPRGKKNVGEGDELL